MSERISSHPLTESAGHSAKAVVLLLLLSTVYGIQYFDQILLGLLVQPIKKELLLSDTQVGLLTGVAFSMFYVVLGFPLARFADRRNRKLIVAVSVVLFSAATAACGLAAGFTSLFLARICVAVGEAGTMPSAVSMLADRFTSSSRRLAMAIHSCGGFSGTAAGLLALSAFSAETSWRLIFWSAGAAGLMLAALIILFGHEPARREPPAAAPRFLADMGALARNTPYVLITLALGVGSISASAAINWAPAFLARSYALPQPKIVLFLAFAWGAGATVGSVIFGLVTSKLNRLGGHWPLLVLSLLALAYPLVFMLAFSAGVLPVSMTGIVVALFLMSGVRGPAFATIQDIVPNTLQATANAAVMFSMYAFGVTVGPLATGMISDALQAYGAADALRYALSIVMAIGAIGAAGLFALAAKKLKRKT
jgi:MFS family permease